MNQYLLSTYAEYNLVSEVQPRHTNDQEVSFPLSTLGCKHITMAQSGAEGPISLKIGC